MEPSNLRLSLAETLWLESEYFERAGADSRRLQTDGACSEPQSESQNESQSEPERESQQWRAYLNSLGLSAFEAWAKENLPAAAIREIAAETEAVRYLSIDGFKTCLITTEHVLSEIVSFPKSIVEQHNLAAHLYVVLEVLEEQQQAIIRGFLRYDELTQQLSRVVQSSASRSSALHSLPLSLWDKEINHLTGYVQYSHPSAIPLPSTAQSTTLSTTENAFTESTLTRLSQWLDETLSEGWQSIDRLINPQESLAWATRQSTLSVKGGKLVNLGMQLGQNPVALIMTVVPEGEKVSVNVQVLPTGEDSVLPPQLTVTLRSNTDRVLQTVTARTQDNYIQLRPFRGRPGIRFTVEVALDDMAVSESFEL